MKTIAAIILALGSCATELPNNLPPERIMCHPAIRPAFPPVIPVDWANVMDLNDAREQQEGYVSRQQVRDWVMTRYIADLEGKLGQCVSNMDWLKERVR